MKRKKTLSKLFFLAFSLVCLFTPSITTTYAITQEEIDEISKRIQNCPDSVQRQFKEIVPDTITSISDLYGTYVVAVDTTQSPGSKEYYITLSCASPSQWEKYPTLFIVLLTGLLVTIFLFSAVKSLVLMAWNKTNDEKYKENFKGLVSSLLYTAGAFASYTIIVFFLVGFVGLGTGGKKEWDIICQQRIVFTLTFTQGVSPCDKTT